MLIFINDIVDNLMHGLLNKMIFQRLFYEPAKTTFLKSFVAQKHPLSPKSFVPAFIFKKFAILIKCIDQMKDKARMYFLHHEISQLIFLSHSLYRYRTGIFHHSIFIPIRIAHKLTTIPHIRLMFSLLESGKCRCNFNDNVRRNE